MTWTRSFQSESATDPAFKAALEEAELRRCLLVALVRARRQASLTQQTVASRMGTTQSAVSELEGVSGDPRLSTLQRYARAVGKRVDVVLATPSASRRTGRVDDIEWLVPHERPYTATDCDDSDIALAS